ncbi:7852_t:CDS:2 [Racocetra fulgida]|uniref:7852_t:CDS:1 n=1 Tax=Racocetra fulgida TaxID=60492 RepID=A0A9N9F4Z5_9GLOM|nr:7852_t:CDS:2 [Racocetra fulgida]
MQKLVLRILGRFSRKTFIRSAWKNLNSLSEHDELVDALEALISMSHEENEFIELITVIADVLSEAPMASAFLCHIIETWQNLVFKHIILGRTKPKKRIRVNVSIIWSVLAEKLAGVRLFALIALEKFGMTGQNKQKILSAEKDIYKILQVLSKELHSDENSINEVYRDIVGVYMDINLGCVRFYLNGKDLGMVHPLNIAQFRKLAESGLHPALSFTSYQQAVVNFGAEKFR